jgi:ABC-type multidrug transport system ATPase subunit
VRQKLAFARALLHRPRLIFLDEPTAGLDPVMAAAVRADLTTLVQQEGVTVFLTTHDLAEAEKLCQQVAVIRHGKLLAIGRPDELRGQGARRAWRSSIVIVACIADPNQEKTPLQLGRFRRENKSILFYITRRTRRGMSMQVTYTFWAHMMIASRNLSW